MRRILRITGLLFAILVLVSIIAIAADGDPIQACLALRDFSRECDWKQIFS